MPTTEHPTQSVLDNAAWPDGSPAPQPNPTARTSAQDAAAGNTAALDPSQQNSDSDAEALSAYRMIEARRARKRRRRIVVGLLLAAAAIAAVAWWLLSGANSQSAPDTDAGNVDVGYASVDTYERSVNASGAIKPESQVVVTPEVEGIITDLRVSEGAHVEKGDVLFSLRNDTLDKAVQDAEQALKSANNGVVAAQNALNGAYAALINAQNAYNTVFSSTFETQEEADAAGAEAESNLSAATSTYDDAQLALENAQIAVTTAEEGLAAAKANADKRTVTAPQAGAVVAMGAVEGSSVGSLSGSSSGSTSASLVTIADLSRLRVSVQVNEVDINSLKEGQKAEVTFSALPDVVLDATVERIAAISSGSGETIYDGGIVTYDVDLVIDQPDPQVKPGMTARVKVITEQIENALIVPAAALQMSGDSEALVFVAPGFTGEGEPSFEERVVTVVAQDDSAAVVEGDIADGDAVQLFFEAEEESMVSMAVAVG